MPSIPRCDNHSVAVIIRDGVRTLMFERVHFPAGVAPAAGHVDGHSGAAAAARSKAADELGLTVVCLTKVTSGWRNNRCRRRPGPRGIGHHWSVYEATVTGKLVPSAAETRNVRWLYPAELQVLADRTAAYARGWLSDVEFECDPGLEPVMVAWLVDIGDIELGPEDLAAIDRVAARGGVNA